MITVCVASYSISCCMAVGAHSPISLRAVSAAGVSCSASLAAVTPSATCLSVPPIDLNTHPTFVVCKLAIVVQYG